MNKIDNTDKENSDDARDPTYFQYYAQLVHQQNMLQDNVRTSMYYSAIIHNTREIKDKIVMDLGAGSGNFLQSLSLDLGILSYFAVQGGAKHVYAIEASNMSRKIQKLLSFHDKNPQLVNKMTVIPQKIEQVKPESIEKVDTIISEPIGVFLVHERMLESYLYARDHYLKPGGTMIPSTGTIFVAPFVDGNLWTQTMSKVRFWEQNNFFGVNLCPLASDALEEIFGQPVVGGFDSKQLLSGPTSYTMNFESMSVSELHEFCIPFEWTVSYTGIIHGIASWFDIQLSDYVLSTAPHLERTHWHQVRLLLKEPLAVNAHQLVKGWIYFKVNSMRSYDITLEVALGVDAPLPNPPLSGIPYKELKDGFIRRHGLYSLHEQNYYFDTYPLPENTKPETLGLYESVSDASFVSMDVHQ